MDSQPKLPLSPGDVVAGRYRVEHAIGAGGMGSVVAARDLRTGAPVAIKCMLPAHVANAEIRTRFQREARVTAWLKSEHIARVLDSGEITPPGSLPATYLVMERLEGRDLRALVQLAGTLPLEEAAEYVRQVCEALAEAHALGIVHRDLKPANLFRTLREDDTPVIKVLDFGIAKFHSANVAGDDIEMTAPSMMLGSRAYMSPEQMLDAKRVDARADIWALGVLFFFLLTGMMPFAGDTISEMTMAILHDEPRRLGDLRPDLAPELTAIVGKCLQKVRDRRFSSAVDLARALEPYARPSRSTALGEMGSRTMELPPHWHDGSVDVRFDETDTTAEPAPLLERAARHGRTWLIAAGGVVAALMVVASALAAVQGYIPARQPLLETMSQGHMAP
jgi:eukaryotic-like serine/threonine-protein kinase